MKSPSEVKARAVKLRDVLRAMGHKLKHTESLEVLSKIEGYPDWNTYAAKLSKGQQNSERQPNDKNTQIALSPDYSFSVDRSDSEILKIADPIRQDIIDGSNAKDWNLYSRNLPMYVIENDEERKDVERQWREAETASSPCTAFSREARFLGIIRKFDSIDVLWEQKNTKSNQAHVLRIVLKEIDGELKQIGVLLSSDGDKMAIDNPNDAPEKIFTLVNMIFTEAIRKGASDIRIEPAEHKTYFRHTIDGVVSELFEPPTGTVTQMVRRIKFMAKLDFTETQKPQEGKISLMIAGQPYEVRVSTLSSTHGEQIVMRLLYSD
jgi:type II secretory ATPase GspE/PulE/Tfp pilus assembly ATPase PilB-like protein